MDSVDTPSNIPETIVIQTGENNLRHKLCFVKEDDVDVYNFKQLLSV